MPGNYPPTVDIPKHPGETTLVMKFAEPKSGTAKKTGKPWWKWTVTEFGVEKSLFGRSQQNVEAMRAAGVYEGATVKISRTEKGDWMVRQAHEEDADGIAYEEDPFPQGRGNHQVPTNPKPLFETIVKEYTTCLVRAREVCTEELEGASNEDIRGIASTLFIQSKMAGVEIPKG